MVRIAAAISLLMAVSCDHGEPDYLFVRVVDGSGGALAVPEDLDAFELRVATITGTADDDDLVRYRRTVPLGDAVSLPQSLSITRAPDTSGTVRVTVLGLRSGRVVQRIERVSAFGVGRVDLPDFALTPLCFGVICPLGQSCETDGVCRDGSTPADAAVDAGPCGPLLVACGDECIAFTDDDCGTCGNACGADERCVSNRCVCDVGTTPCGDRCVDLNSALTDCGACDAACDVANGTPVCDAGACRIAVCDPQFGDCDLDAITGCETRLDTATDCTGCGLSCSYPGGSSECRAAGCVIGSCNPGRADCNADPVDGCETSTTTVNDCGACGNRCSVMRGTAGCSGGSCVIAGCNGGRADCNGSYADGCETNLTSLNDCGACRSRCAPANATASCASGTCEIASCNAGRADCDGGVGNGCETNLDTDESNCGSCGVSCGANENCVGGTCQCPNNMTYEDNRGPCLPSCGRLLNITGSPRGGTSCCMTGCTTAVVGGFRASYDCDYCCEASVGTNACL